MESYISQFQPYLQQVWKKENFKTATAIQLRSAEPILAKKDVIAASPTGTGKTVAYLLPLLQQLNEANDNIQAIILASSHELVMQIYSVVQTWTKDSNIRPAAFIGGANIKRQIERLKKRPQLIVGTPGRVHELIQMKKLKMHHVNAIVLDEGDQLLTAEHSETIETIIKAAMANCQLLLFSATLPKETEEKAIALMNEPAIIRIEKSDTGAKVQHTYIVTEARKKIDIVRKIGNIEKIKGIVFIRDIGNLSVIAEKLRYKGLDVAVLHRDANKQKRQQALKMFKDGKCPLLLATDVAARGLDIADVTHVIHYDVATDVHQYLHRSGRTGRLGQKHGTVISIVTVGEIKKMKQLAKQANISIGEVEVYSGQLRSKKSFKPKQTNENVSKRKTFKKY